jgi:hypothetical protein
LFFKDSAVNQIGKVVVAAMLIGLLVIFLTILHLSLVSRGEVAFCDLCKLYWFFVALLILDYCIRCKSRFVLSMVSILPMGILLLYQPNYLGTWTKFADTLLESSRKPGLRVGRVVKNLPGIPETGAVVLLSNCPPCRTEVKGELQTFLRESVHSDEPLTFVFVQDSSDKTEILPWISRAEVVTLSAQNAESYFTEFNIPLKTYPYVIFLKNNTVSSQSRLFGE